MLTEGTVTTAARPWREAGAVASAGGEKLFCWCGGLLSISRTPGRVRVLAVGQDSRLKSPDTARGAGQRLPGSRWTERALLGGVGEAAFSSVCPGLPAHSAAWEEHRVQETSPAPGTAGSLEVPRGPAIGAVTGILLWKRPHSLSSDRRPPTHLFTAKDTRRGRQPPERSVLGTSGGGLGGCPERLCGVSVRRAPGGHPPPASPSGGRPPSLRGPRARVLRPVRAACLVAH